MQSPPEILLHSTKIHAWADGSEIRGQVRFGVFFLHAEYDNISEPVVGPQTNNGAEVSAVRARICAVHNTQELCLYSDSKWCVIFLAICSYINAAKGKQPVRHHDIWEDI